MITYKFLPKQSHFIEKQVASSQKTAWAGNKAVLDAVFFRRKMYRVEIIVSIDSPSPI
jgi:hypothetical protein